MAGAAASPPAAVLSSLTTSSTPSTARTTHDVASASASGDSAPLPSRKPAQQSPSVACSALHAAALLTLACAATDAHLWGMKWAFVQLCCAPICIPSHTLPHGLQPADVICIKL